MRKPVLVYFHRYSIEDEAVQFPGLAALLEALKEHFQVSYVSMKGIRALEPKLRQDALIHELKLTVNPTNNFDKWFKTLLYYIALPKLIFILKKIDPDLILCKEPMPFLPSIISRTRKPLVIDIGDWWWSIMLGGFSMGKKLATTLEKIEISDWIKKNLFALVHTQAEAQFLLDFNFPSSRMKRVGSSHAKEKFFPCDVSELRSALKIEKEDWVVAVHGIMHPSKGYDQLLEWWKTITATHNNWKLMMIGGAGNEVNYRKKVQELNLEKNVVFTGWLATQNELNKFLNVADCLLVTRRNSPENKGVVPSSLNHNLATGKPTIVTNLPGMAEFIEHGINGYLYEPDNFDSFKNILEYIESNSSAAKQTGERGMKLIETRFNSETTALDYVTALKEILINYSNK